MSAIEIGLTIVVLLLFMRLRRVRKDVAWYEHFHEVAGVWYNLYDQLHEVVEKDLQARAAAIRDCRDSNTRLEMENEFYHLYTALLPFHERQMIQLRDRDWREYLGEEYKEMDHPHLGHSA